VTSALNLASRAPSRSGSGEGLLAGAAGLWWFVTILGQWAFLAYLAGFYVRAELVGAPQRWNLNHDLFRGFVAADPAWNLYFGAHVTLAAVIAFGGVVQMVPQIRERALWFHRWNGRAFMLTAAGGALTGLWMVWARGIGVSGSTKLGLVAISLDAVLILVFAAAAWVLARTGKIERHRRWALRLFMAANGVWFLRLQLFGWYILAKGVGLTDHLDGPMNIVFDFASYLLPLAVLELYLRARASAHAGLRLAASAVLLGCTAYMAVGIFALSTMELPLVGRF
jgi:uncharacterized membrane protein